MWAILFKEFLAIWSRGLEVSHRNFEIFGVGGTICTHRSRYRPAMAVGVGAH
jgi:hypothetical protein